MAFCDTLATVGLTIGLFCTDPVTGKEDIIIPKNDYDLYNVKPAPKPPAPPPPAPVVIAPPPPAMPPVIINKPKVVEKVVEKIIERVVEKPVYIEKEPPPPPPKIDHTKEAIEAHYMRRVAFSSNNGLKAFEANHDKADDNKQASISDMPFGSIGTANAKTADKKVMSNRYPSAKSTSASDPIDATAMVRPDRFIKGIVVNAVNSQIDSSNKDASASVIIQVSDNVYGMHSRTIVIPAGSMMICDYLTPEEIGITRVTIKCNTVYLAGSEAEINQIDGGVADAAGQAGVSGEVDDRFWEKYGTAFLLSGISTATRIGTALTADKDKKNTTLKDAVDKGGQELSTKFGDITASVLEDNINLQPIIKIKQGTRVTIRPAKVWYLVEKKG